MAEKTKAGYFMNAKSGKIKLISSMAIFGTIGIFRRYIPLPSSLVALSRGIIGTAFLLLMLLRRKSPDWNGIRKKMPMLFVTGSLIGFNWILLFEAYCYTSVATATLCYYLAPVLVMLAAPIVLKEKLTLRQALCAAVALCGMIPVSGVLENSINGPEEIRGILCGIGAAILYAAVILMNKRMTAIPSYEKTVLQLLFASVTLLPYVLLTENISNLEFTSNAVFFLAFIGIVHTGFAYWMYFSSIEKLEAHMVAIWSYLDPVLAIVFSTVFLKEPMGISSMVGAVMILGAAYLCEQT